MKYPHKTLLLLSFFSLSAIAQISINNPQDPVYETNPIKKYSHHILSDETEITSLTIKIQEGMGIVVQNNSFIQSSREHDRSIDMVTSLSIINQILIDNSFDLERSFNKVPPEELLALKTTAELHNPGRTFANLNLYSTISLPQGTIFNDIIDDLESFNALRIVEIAYSKPKTILPTIITSTVQTIQPTGTDLIEFQGYLKPASQGGIDAFYAWDFEGGHGEGVKIIDFEASRFFLGNVDLPSSNSLIYNEVPPSQINDNGAHAASVLGIMSAKDETQEGNDAFGIKGIAHNAEYGIVVDGGKFILPKPGNPAPPLEETHETLTLALEALSPGDILLIEFAHIGRVYDGDTVCAVNGLEGDLGEIPLEFDDEVYDVIEIYTANPFNIVVIEGAANSNINLDDARYNGVFSRDSGAIIVGAKKSDQNEKSCFSNFGGAVKVHAWGDSIYTTTSPGDIFPNSIINLGGNDKLYTSLFGGTSGAAPIVAGAAAVIQSILAENGLPKLNSFEMRDLLSATGTLQTDPSEGNIGSMPDLRAAIDFLLPPIIPPPTPIPDAYEDDDTLAQSTVFDLNVNPFEIQNRNFSDDSIDYVHIIKDKDVLRALCSITVDSINVNVDICVDVYDNDEQQYIETFCDDSPFNNTIKMHHCGGPDCVDYYYGIRNLLGTNNESEYTLFQSCIVL